MSMQVCRRIVGLGARRAMGACASRPGSHRRLATPVQAEPVAGDEPRVLLVTPGPDVRLRPAEVARIEQRVEAELRQQAPARFRTIALASAGPPNSASAAEPPSLRETLPPGIVIDTRAAGNAAAVTLGRPATS